MVKTNFGKGKEISGKKLQGVIEKRCKKGKYSPVKLAKLLANVLRTEIGH
jgi:hypothetical protein